jgi:hypothetical protein
MEGLMRKMKTIYLHRFVEAVAFFCSTAIYVSTVLPLFTAYRIEFSDASTLLTLAVTTSIAFAILIFWKTEVTKSKLFPKFTRAWRMRFIGAAVFFSGLALFARGFVAGTSALDYELRSQEKIFQLYTEGMCVTCPYGWSVYRVVDYGFGFKITERLLWLPDQSGGKESPNMTLVDHKLRVEHANLTKLEVDTRAP